MKYIKLCFRLLLGLFMTYAGISHLTIARQEFMDRYYLDALIGIIPGWGDAIALLSVVPFVYFSSRVIKKHPFDIGRPE